MFDKLSIIKYGVLLKKRGLILSIILSSVFYTSYFVFSFYIPQQFVPSPDDRLMVQMSFNFIIVIALLVTNSLIHRINKLHVIYACSIGTSISLALLFLAPSDIFKLVFLFAIAIFFSLGQLAFLAHFWRLTVPEERGRVAGFIGFIFLLFHVIMYTSTAGTLDFPQAVALGLVLSLGSLVVILLKPEKAVLSAKIDERENYSEKRTVILYLIPWVLFSVINATLARTTSFHISQQVPASLYLLLIVLQIIGTIFGTVIGGVTADFFGRRISLAFSLTLYGISSALAGLASNFTLLYFVYIANGMSWGILLAMYIFVIWGDLSIKENCTKMYAIGLITFYLTQGIGLLPLEQIFQIPLVASSLVSCLLIFLSNIPVFLAPELLPSGFRERIKLKLHMDAVKKIKQAKDQG